MTVIPKSRNLGKKITHKCFNIFYKYYSAKTHQTRKEPIHVRMFNHSAQDGRSCQIILTAMMQIDLLHSPINAEIMIGDCHLDLRIFCFSGGCD